MGYPSKVRFSVKCLAWILFMFAVLVFGGLSPANAAKPWTVELGAGIGKKDAAKFATMRADYNMNLGSLVLAPGVSGTIFHSPDVAFEGNVDLRGTYPLSDRLALLFGVQRGLGFAGDVYCHQSWQVGVAASFGRTQLSVFKGANARTVWTCGGNLQDSTAIALTHRASERHDIGLRITSHDLGLVVGWHF